MDAEDAVASPGASLDDVEEDMILFVGRQVEERVSAQQHDKRLAFEREKEALREAREAREEERRIVQQKRQELERKLQELERDDVADADKEKRLEHAYNAAIDKLNSFGERLIARLHRSAQHRAPASPVPEPPNVAIPEESPVAPSRTLRETEDEQAQNVRDAQQRRSSRPRRLTRRAQFRATDTAPDGDSSPEDPAPVPAATVQSSPSRQMEFPSRQPIRQGPPPPVTTHKLGRRRRGVRDGDDDHEETNRRPQKRTKNSDRTVSFEEVYGDGNPEYRHAIVEYPKDSGKWFIIRCDQCGVHFNTNPLRGGAKHISSQIHGNLRRENTVAVQVLGFQVRDCDEEKVKLNNDAFRDALAAGYVPLGSRTGQVRRLLQESEESGNENTRQQQETHRHPPTVTPTPQERRETRKPFEGITDPVVGKMYRAWYRGKGYYIVLMLPIGNFRAVGVVGDITMMDRQKKAPKCYRRAGKEILGWAHGYEDGGPKVRDRKFPMMYIEDSADMSFEGDLMVPPSLGWVEAKDLRPFSIDDPECRSTRGFANARILSLGRERMRSSTTTGGRGGGGESISGIEDQGTSLHPSTTQANDRADHNEDDQDEDGQGEDGQGEDGQGEDGQGEDGQGEDGEDAQDEDTQEDEPETEDEKQDSGQNRGVSASASPPNSAAQMLREVAAAAEYEGYSPNSDREPYITAPVGGEPRPDNLESGERVVSQQDSSNERRNQHMGSGKSGAVDTHTFVETLDQEPPGAASSSGIPGEPVVNPIVLDRATSMALTIQGPAPESMGQDEEARTLPDTPARTNGRPSELSDTQFFVDFHRVAQDLLTEARTSKSRPVREGGPAGRGAPLRAARRGSIRHTIPRLADLLTSPEDDPDNPFDGPPDTSPAGWLSPSEFARRALQLNEEVEAAFDFSPVLNSSPATLWTNGQPGAQTSYWRNVPNAEQQGPPMKTTGQQDSPAQITLPSIVQARNQVQIGGRPLVNKGPTLPFMAGSDRRQSFNSGHYSIAQPLPATSGPLPAPMPSFPLPVSQQRNQHPPPPQPVYHFL